jgi:hypothetical protein
LRTWATEFTAFSLIGGWEAFTADYDRAILLVLALPSSPAQPSDEQP